MKKQKKPPKRAKKAIDSISQETGESAKKRGRPGVPVNWVAGRAYNYGLMISANWDALKEPLLNAGSKEDVEAALLQIHGTQRDQFRPYAELVLKVVKEKKFPRTDKAQIRFIGDSIAGQGRISPRRARDICTRERSRVTYKIIRQEYFIECSCKYKGPANNGGCPKCGTTDVAFNAGPGDRWTLR